MTGQVAPMVASSWIEKLGGDSMRVAFRIPPALGVGAGFAVEKGRSASNAQTKSLNLRLFIRELLSVRSLESGRGYLNAISHVKPPCV